MPWHYLPLCADGLDPKAWAIRCASSALQGYVHEATYVRQATESLSARLFGAIKNSSHPVSRSFKFRMGTDRDRRTSVQGALDCHTRSHSEIDWI
jgi:hypothetical protein